MSAGRHPKGLERRRATLSATPYSILSALSSFTPLPTRVRNKIRLMAPHRLDAALSASPLLQRELTLYRQQCACTHRVQQRVHMLHSQLDRVLVFDLRFRWWGLGNNLDQPAALGMGHRTCNILVVLWRAWRSASWQNRRSFLRYWFLFCSRRCGLELACRKRAACA